MMHQIGLRGLLFSVFLAAFVFSAEEEKKEPAPETRPPELFKQWEDMDYGPYFSYPVKQSNKPRIIRLEGGAKVCYDTELMRLAGAWTDAKIIGTNPSISSKKDGDTYIAGNLQFGTGPGPGWAKDGSFQDPRQPWGKDQKLLGRLPNDWARYHGLFLSGDKVLLFYSVGACKIMEMPSFKEVGGIPAFTRTFLAGESAAPLTMLVCDGGSAASGGVGPVGQAPGTAKSGSVVDSIACVTIKDGGKEWVIAVGAVGTPKGSEWEVSGGRIHLRLPPMSGSVAFKIVTARLPAADLPKFPATMAGNALIITEFTKGGAPRWKELTTRGVIGQGDAAYVVDTITPPDDNPWKLVIKFCGIDFFPDGRAALCSLNGDVWIASGIDSKLEKITWKRFATGLAQPTGLKIVDGIIHTTGRDQITRLFDLNEDGEADYYENFNNDYVCGTEAQDAAYDLQTDRAGDFYIGTDGHYSGPTNGAMLKISKDGTNMQIIATGFRCNFGIGVGPNDEITCSDQEGGEVVPACPIYLLKKGAYYGFKDQSRIQPPPEKGEPPMLWLPKNVDRSPGSQLWVDSDKWGPFKGHMLSTSYRFCTLLHIMMQRVGDETNGAVMSFPIKLASGICRGRVNPVDGQVYLCGLRGWDTEASRDTTFQRVRYTGKPVSMPINFRLIKGGVELIFAVPLDPATAEDPSSYDASMSNIKWGQPYVPYSVREPAKKGRDEIKIKSVKLENKKVLTLLFEDLRPCSNFDLLYNIKGADGSRISQQFYMTINKLP